MSEETKLAATLSGANPPANQNGEGSDDLDFSPFFDYLQSPEGHNIASRIVTLIEETKKVTIDKSYSNAKFNRWMEVSVIIVVVIATVVLSILDKLNPTVGILLGSIVGYFFGKSK